MRGLKLFAVAFAWYFLVGGDQPSGFSGGGTTYTLVGPFANSEQCEFVKKQIRRYNYLSGCWADGK